VNAQTQKEGNRTPAGYATLRIWLLGICGLAIIIGGAFPGCSRDPSGPSDDDVPANAIAPPVASSIAQVSVRNLQFSPMSIEVKKGDTIEWKNDDLVPHTATSAAFNSGTIASGQSWQHTFTQAGNFPYVCTFHPQMKGVVIVR
jgi:plastocyanin